MKKAPLSESLKAFLRPIMRDHALAKFGDSLTNFLYSLIKTKVLGKPTGERVHDKALAEAVRQSNLRSIMPSNSSAGELADGAEALLAFAYLHDLLTMDEMVELLESSLNTKTEEDFSSNKKERALMTKAFVVVLLEIKERLKIENN